MKIFGIGHLIALKNGENKKLGAIIININYMER
jgi:hypothetical protein